MLGLWVRIPWDILGSEPWTHGFGLYTWVWSKLRHRDAFVSGLALPDEEATPLYHFGDFCRAVVKSWKEEEASEEGPA